MLRIFKLGLYIVFHCNIIKTLYLNFKKLPFNQAIKLPIWIYGKITFRSLRGDIVIDSDRIYSGMIKIGKRDYYVNTGIPQTILTLNGILKFNGNVNFQVIYENLPFGTEDFGRKSAKRDGPFWQFKKKRRKLVVRRMKNVWW